MNTNLRIKGTSAYIIIEWLKKAEKYAESNQTLFCEIEVNLGKNKIDENKSFCLNKDAKTVLTLLEEIFPKTVHINESRMDEGSLDNCRKEINDSLSSIKSAIDFIEC